MTGNELYEEYCYEYPMIQGYREVTYESWLQQQVIEYRTQVVNNNVLLPLVNGSLPEHHIIDIDGDIIESLHCYGHAIKLRDAINNDEDCKMHHYQVSIKQ